MHTDSITTKDRNFASAIVRHLCAKTCTFTVTSDAAPGATCLISPFILHRTKAADKFLEYNYWLSRNKIKDNAEITIRLFADISGQARKVIEMATATERVQKLLTEK